MGTLESVQVIVPPAPTEGVLQFQLVGEVSETKVVPFGKASLNVAVNEF
jgi:hypothetical protein